MLIAPTALCRVPVSRTPARFRVEGLGCRVQGSGLWFRLTVGASRPWCVAVGWRIFVTWRWVCLTAVRQVMAALCDVEVSAKQAQMMIEGAGCTVGQVRLL